MKLSAILSNVVHRFAPTCRFSVLVNLISAIFFFNYKDGKMRSDASLMLPFCFLVYLPVLWMIHAVSKHSTGNPHAASFGHSKRAKVLLNLGGSDPNCLTGFLSSNMHLLGNLGSAQQAAFKHSIHPRLAIPGLH